MKKEILSLIEQCFEMAKKRPAVDLKGELIRFIDFIHGGGYEIVNVNKLIEIVKTLKEITLIEKLEI